MTIKEDIEAMQLAGLTHEEIACELYQKYGICIE